MAEKFEKKLVSLPPARVTEEMLDELKGLACLKDRSMSYLVRMAVARLLDEEAERSQAFNAIFSGRERRGNPSHADQCKADTTSEVSEVSNDC